MNIKYMYCKIINKQKENLNQDFIFSFDYLQLEEKREQKEYKQMKDKKTDKKTDKKKEQNELKNNDIFSLNEITISEKLMKINGWQKYTSPVLHSSLVLSLGKYLLVKEKMDFSLFSLFSLYFVLKDKKERREEGPIGEHKENFVQIISIYHSLLKVLEWTESNSLVSLSCNLNNIVFDRDKFCNVKLADFSHSFFIKDTIDLSAFMQIIQINEFTPLGLKVLHYLKMNKCESLSSNNIQEICSGFIEGLKRFNSLDLFPLDFLQEVEKKCIFSLQSLINKEKERIVLELLKGSSYWDHFSMSVMFLIMIKVIGQNTNTNKFVSEFTSILLNNILNRQKNEELTFC